MVSRRTFFKAIGLMGASALVANPWDAFAHNQPTARTRKAARLQAGQTLGIVAPGGALGDAAELEPMQQALEQLGFRVVLGQNVLARHGYLAGTDAERAHDLNAFFADPNIHGILALRGGWGSARLLHLLDYKTIARHPKALIGYSDITALLLALQARTGLVTVHGPVGISSWNEFTLRYFRPLVMEAQMPVYEQPAELPYTVIHPGVCQGTLLGGNLSVLAAMLGSDYLPRWRGAILFLEDIDEEVYRIDRMLTQLHLAGVLPQLAGFVFGQCTNCQPKDPDRSLSLEQVLQHHIAPLGIPAFAGAAFGHVADKFSLPLGVACRLDAQQARLELLEPAFV